MITALKLVFSPFPTWQKIAAARRSVGAIILSFLLPLFLVGLLTETFSLTHWGERREDLVSRVNVSQETAVRYAGTQLGLLLASIFVTAQVLMWIAHSSQVQSGFTQCFALMAYGFSPIVLARLLDAIPGFNTWLCWGLGALASLSVLYHGVGLALKPDQTKGFGLYLISILLVLFSSFLSHLMAVFVLRGKLIG